MLRGGQEVEIGGLDLTTCAALIGDILPSKASLAVLHCCARPVVCRRQGRSEQKPLGSYCDVGV
jgi:hypothetical protein